jgi:hypothetical protein
VDAGLDAMYKIPVSRFISFLFCILFLQFDLSFASTNDCREILKHPFLRDEKTLKQEIFGLADYLLKEFSEQKNLSSSKLFFLSPEQKQEFVLQNKNKIIENLHMQDTALEPIGKSSTYFYVSGGMSRLGRVATGLRKLGVNIYLDIELVDSPGIYMHDYKTIVLGLEDALYPNQMSFHLLHNAYHVLNYERSLFVPTIFDKSTFQTTREFALDDIIVLKKIITQMLGNQKVEKQNSLSPAGDGKNLGLRPAMVQLRELSKCTLRKKKDLLKVIQYLKQIEENPKILNDKEFFALFEAMGAEIVFDVHALELAESYPGSIKEKARESIKLIEEALSIAESSSFLK